MEYKIIDAMTEKNKSLVEFIRAQEADHMMFVANKERYEALLAAGLPDGMLKTKIQNELPVYIERIAEVEAILNATYAQISDADIAAVISAEVQY